MRKKKKKDKVEERTSTGGIDDCSRTLDSHDAACPRGGGGRRVAGFSPTIVLSRRPPAELFPSRCRPIQAIASQTSSRRSCCPGPASRSPQSAEAQSPRAQPLPPSSSSTGVVYLHQPAPRTDAIPYPLPPHQLNRTQTISSAATPARPTNRELSWKNLATVTVDRKCSVLLRELCSFVAEISAQLLPLLLLILLLLLCLFPIPSRLQSPNKPFSSLAQYRRCTGALRRPSHRLVVLRSIVVGAPSRWTGDRIVRWPAHPRAGRFTTSP